MDCSTFPRIIIFIMALVGIGFVSWVPNASASYIWPKDAKVYPGTTCLQFRGSGNLAYAEDGSIKNTDARRSISVNCPIIRDLTEKRRGLDRVTVRSENGKLASCQVRVIQQTKTGSGYKTLRQKKTKQNGKNYNAYFGDHFPDGVMYMVSCTLSPGARLIAYYAHERRHSGSLPPPFF